MAGDWIKLQHATPDKPEVMKMAKLLKCPAEQVVGHLVRVWSWADEQSLDGHALDVTDSDVARIARHAEFATAMRSVGWLTGSEGALSFPNFDRHNGESAKKRALAADRKRRERSRTDGDDHVTRGEERKEEELQSSVLRTSPPPFPQSSAGEQKQKDRNSLTRGTRLRTWFGEAVGFDDAAHEAKPETWVCPFDFKAAALTLRPDLDPDVTWARFRDHWIAVPGAKGTKLDWPATWRKWVNGEDRGASPVAGKQAALEQRNRQVADAWKPPELRGEEQPAALALPVDGEPY